MVGARLSLRSCRLGGRKSRHRFGRSLLRRTVVQWKGWRYGLAGIRTPLEYSWQHLGAQGAAG